jgi:hypothetical protein
MSDVLDLLLLPSPDGDMLALMVTPAGHFLVCATGTPCTCGGPSSDEPVA